MVIGNPIMAGGGGNLKNAYAIISVEYPAGSTVTCTNTATGKTYKAGNTYGAWAFGVNSAGTWTVTATKDSQSKIVNVDITEQGQGFAVTISYNLTLFENGRGVVYSGNFEQAYTVTYSYLTIDENIIKINDTNGYGLKNESTVKTTVPINLTPFTQLVFKASHIGSAGSQYMRPRFGAWLGSRTDFKVEFDAFQLFTSAIDEEQILDISGLDGEYYIGAATGGQAYTDITFIELR